MHIFLHIHVNYEKSSLISIHAVTHPHCQAQLFSPANAMIILKKSTRLGKIGGICLFSSSFSLPKIHAFLFSSLTLKKKKGTDFTFLHVL